MPESTLSISYTDLRRAVGRFLGYAEDAAAWDDREAADVEEAIRSGVRTFYSPPMVTGDRVPHQWSFLRPRAALTTAPGQADYDLPDDFAAMAGSLAFAPPERHPEIRVVAEPLLRRMGQAVQQNAVPAYACVRPVAPAADAGTRWTLTLSPTPDGIYTLAYRYLVQAQALSEENPYPHGGARHAETILQSCLAAAEVRMDNRRGEQYARFLELLAASVMHDRREGEPDYYGYNGDASDPAAQSAGVRRAGARVTYNGVLYD